LNLTGRFEEAVATAEGAMADAHRLRSAVHEMQLAIVLGVLYANRGKVQDAERTLQDALTLALRAGDDESTAASLTVLSWIVGVRQGHATEAEVWNRHAAAVISRLREPALWEQRRLKTLGRLRILRGDYASAVDALSDAARLGENGGAIPDADRAIVEEDLGYALGLAGKAGEAGVHVRRALEIEERVSGPQSPHVATTRTTLASVLYREGRYAEALEQLRLARTVLERTVGESRELGEVFDGLGTNLFATGDAAGALPQHRRASEILRRSEGEKSAVTAHALASEGADLIALQRWREALPLLERALGAQETAKAEPIDLAETRASLAEAIWKTGGDRNRARKLAEDARVTFAEAVARYGSGRERRRLAELAGWIDAHAARERPRLGAR
jgi:tetratricopeptide (TPR) repeat protein